MNYLSFFPGHLDKVFITGGIPPLNAHPDEIYRATYKRVLKKNKLFFEIFPQAKINAKKIADFIFENGDAARVACNDWSDKITKKYNYADELKVSITKGEFQKFINNEAYN